MFSNQIKTLIKKNFIESYRTRELFIESAVPIIVAIMLSLKSQLGVLNQILPIMFSLSVSGTSRSIMIQLVDEKSKRYKETQKIMGMSNKSYMMGWFITAYIRMAITVLVFILAQLFFNNIFDQDWQQNYTASFGMLQLEFIIYAFTAINQSFFFASLFNESKIAGEVSTFITVAMTFFIFMIIMPQAANSQSFYIIISTVSPQCNCSFGFVASLQSFIANPQVTNFFPISLVISTYTLQDATVQLSISYFAYLFLFIYCDQVVPNEYGISKHPLFFLDFFKLKQKKPILNSLEQSLQEIDIQSSQVDVSSATYHEQIQINEVPTIKIENLNKEYGNLKAVDNLTLHLYESQIFCLLGHNGAGKTTTISLLTGLVKKSGGNVLMYGMSLDKDLHQIRNSLGLCTQRDCLYDGLTVQEHLQFIGGIKGGISLLEIDSLLNKTDLMKERHSLVSTLSGGSKRKLSLAMALVGNSKIIFLDEPTSGMDAYSRRAIWDILERIKQEKRTIILTTHHLDEAEILADRIGIMSRGQLLAVGSSDFIKKKFGEGYNLRLGFSNPDQRQQISDLVRHHIPMNSLIQESTTDDTLCFLIPFKSQNLLEKLFEELEKIGDINIQMQMNTLEDAFVNIGLEEEKRILLQEETQQSRDSDEEQELTIHSNKSKLDIQIPRCLSSPPSYKFTNQVKALFLRRFYTLIRTDTNFIALLIPALTLFLGLFVVNYMAFPSGSVYSSAKVQQYLRVMISAITCIIGFCFNSTIYISLPVQEKETQLKAVLHGMGLRILPYWLGTFIFDLLVYGILIIFYYIIAFSINLTAVTDYFWQTLFVFVCFGFSYIPYAYLWGFVFNTTDKALKLFAIFNFFIMFNIPVMTLAILNYLRYKQNESLIIEYIMYASQLIFMMVSPFFTFLYAYALVQGKQNYEMVQYILEPSPILIERYWIYAFALISQGIHFSSIIYYLENKQKKNKVNNNGLKYEKIGLEQDVIQEYDRVLDLQCQDQVKSVLLQKKYKESGPEILDKTTFGVKEGQIFGIIGPNGAGKSTLLNLFSGLVRPTGGVAQIMKKDVQTQNMDIQQHVGICPQFDSIWDNLTPLEHLSLFGMIKGLVGVDLEEAKNYFVQTMQLKAFQETQAGRLSGGNKRKLCVADALIGGSDITFFDEPSTGVDPLARRFLFNTLKRNVKLRNCSVIITTHTIEEAEVLSDKIGYIQKNKNSILIVGQFKCIGSPEYLRKTYGTGYQINLKYVGNADDLFITIQQAFNSAKQMEDKRPQYMTISISAVSFSFYKTFQFFEHKKRNGQIDEFSINQSSLESVFIHLSRIQMESNKQNGLTFD